MENASKALLIAGGVLIIIILASLILLVKANISNFYASQDELQMSTDKAKFNEEFTRFNRNDVAGYELISLANKVIDYNERISTETSSGSGNDVQADPVKIVITLWDGSTITKDTVKLKLSNDGTLRLFKSDNASFALIEDSGAATALNKDKYSKDKSKLKDVLVQITRR